jgi:hypothetical protein
MKLRRNQVAMTLVKSSVIAASAWVAVSLTGCAAIGTEIQHHRLETNTKMSKSVFLNPVSKKQQTVYVQTKNTSGSSGLNLSTNIKRDLKRGGYRIMRSPSQAHYMIQTNIIKAGKTNERGVQSILSSGFGGAITGGLIGLGAGSIMGDSGDATLAGGLIGSAVGFAADALVKDQLFALVTDVQISERAAKGTSFQSQTKASVSQGMSAQQVIRTSGKTPWMRYRTRVVSTADKVNLSFNAAKPILSAKTAQSITGLFVNS